MPELTVQDLLLAPHLERSQVTSLLAPYGFKDLMKADSNLQAMASDPAERQLLAEILDNILTTASHSAEPDQALTYLERFAQAALNKMRLFSYLKDSPSTIELLLKTLGGSPYMAEILIRDPHHFYWVTDPQTLDSGRPKRAIQREIVQAMRAIRDERKRLNYLRSLKRREMLHIGIRDLLRICSVEETLTALSVLAEALITAVHWISASALRDEYQTPRGVFSQFTVLAMGKLGGGELNFSSDVDLIYLYASDKETHGEVTARQYFRRLSQKITVGLNEFTEEGYVYRVDLRLRPEGAAGNIADPLDGYARYYRTRAGTWERLALLKAWPVAGDRRLGRAFLDLAREIIYDQPFDVEALEDVRDIKRRIDQQMGLRDQRTRNVKLGTGGIREIELIAQSLQVSHGGRIEDLRGRGTLRTLRSLAQASLITQEECETLCAAYIFLRDVENKLQIANDAQTHALPRDAEEVTVLARRLGYPEADTAQAGARFIEDYRRTTNQVNRIFENRILSGQL